MAMVKSAIANDVPSMVMPVRSGWRIMSRNAMVVSWLTNPSLDIETAQELAVNRRRRRPHGDRRRQGKGGTHCLGRPGDRRQDRDAGGDDIDVLAVAEDEERKAVELGIKARPGAAKPGAGDGADENPDKRDHQDKLEVMPEARRSARNQMP